MFNHSDDVLEKIVYNKPPFGPIATENMANLLMEMKSFKLKHVSPVNIILQRKRKNSLELHLASSLEKKFKLDNENGDELDNENADEW